VAAVRLQAPLISTTIEPFAESLVCNAFPYSRSRKLRLIQFPAPIIFLQFPLWLRKEMHRYLISGRMT
jgi:hypothetical protein